MPGICRSVTTTSNGSPPACRALRIALAHVDDVVLRWRSTSATASRAEAWSSTTSTRKRSSFFGLRLMQRLASSGGES